MKKSIRLRARALARFSAPALSVLSLAVAASVQAQGIEVNPVVVSASRMEQPLSQVLSSVSVITRADIDKSQAATLADLLQGEAGFEFGRNGGPGTTTSFFLRGQDSINTVVLMDGVRAQVDQIGAIQTTDFPLHQIERVEILKGNVSALYGNGAIGGVINIITRENKGVPKAYGSASLGSYNTHKASAGYGGTVEDVNFDLNVGQDKSAGFSAVNTTQKTLANPDVDGYKNQYAGAKFEKRISTDTKIGVRLNYNLSNVDYDNGNSFSNTPTDVHKFKRTTESVSGYVRQVVNSDWVSNLNLAHSEYKYDDTLNGAPWPSSTWTNSYFQGRQNALSWNNTYQLQAQTKAVFGADLNEDAFDAKGLNNAVAYVLNRRSQGYFAGATHQIDKLSIQANARRDVFQQQKENSAAGGNYTANTGLLGLGYQLDSFWSLTGTVSSGFSAPTVYAVNSNANIKPEHHHSQEVGTTYQVDDLLMRVLYFQSHAKDAIIYNNAYQYINSDIDNKGWELTARAKVQGYSIKSSVTLQAPRDVGQNLSQARRAKEYGSLDVSKILSGYELGTRLYAAGSRRDSNFTSTTLSGYSTLAFYVSRKIDNEWTARVKLDNAFDRQYQLAYGYNTPGRGIYATLQYQPK
ncbi:TonB-dependent receptor [Limnohabitans sp. TEGF004]|uniref:TonB-dependent receptor plug domain-containing protein n=1 Tax=Limnohabitans sp. TEGF004 TaxID=2986281 RepID=UPI0023774E0C|nr:TonB-dependent receptor [Limnohabitans sp. TEGF004]BDU55089.1 outer membrane receptor protein [Limnohabitans sp. TEGF004]